MIDLTFWTFKFQILIQNIGDRNCAAIFDKK